MSARNLFALTLPPVSPPPKTHKITVSPFAPDKGVDIPPEPQARQSQQWSGCAGRDQVAPEVTCDQGHPIPCPDPRPSDCGRRAYSLTPGQRQERPKRMTTGNTRAVQFNPNGSGSGGYWINALHAQKKYFPKMGP